MLGVILTQFQSSSELIDCRVIKDGCGGQLFAESLRQRTRQNEDSERVEAKLHEWDVRV